MQQELNNRAVDLYKKITNLRTLLDEALHLVDPPTLQLMVTEAQLLKFASHQVEEARDILSMKESDQVGQACISRVSNLASKVLAEAVCNQ